MSVRVELVYFTGCPRIEEARTLLRAALGSAGFPPVWTEWNQYDPEAPEWVQEYGSPMILIAGQPMSENGRDAEGDACLVGELPTVEALIQAVSIAPEESAP